MKKILLLIGILFISISNVYAKDNRLYFIEDNDKLYYDSKSFDEELFMNHTDMLPGEIYTDELILENSSKKTYTLYFKIKERQQSEEADSFLNYIDMNIYLDNELIYSGNIKGNNYEDVNLKNAIKLLDIKPNQISNMKVETYLDTSYDNYNNTTNSYIDFEFYSQYDKEETNINTNDDEVIVEKSEVQLIQPKTGDNIYLYVGLLIISSLTFIILYYKQRVNKKTSRK